MRNIIVPWIPVGLMPRVSGVVICTLRLLNSDPRQQFPFVLIFSIKKPSLRLIKLKENIVATLL